MTILHLCAGKEDNAERAESGGRDTDTESAGGDVDGDANATQASELVGTETTV
jgi:hypothetical protein